jgi:hypothetical protein
MIAAIQAGLLPRRMVDRIAGRTRRHDRKDDRRRMRCVVQDGLGGRARCRGGAEGLASAGVGSEQRIIAG